MYISIRKEQGEEVEEEDQEEDAEVWDGQRRGGDGGDGGGERGSDKMGLVAGRKRDGPEITDGGTGTGRFGTRLDGAFFFIDIYILFYFIFFKRRDTQETSGEACVCVYMNKYM